MTKSDAEDGNTGYAAVEVVGGTLPYHYAWSNGASSPGISGLSGGTYTVTVTDENGCSETGSVVVEQISTTPLSVSIASFSNISCNGGQNGSATAAAQGGYPPYTYAWSNGQNGTTTAGLTAGTYTISVTDDNNGQATTQVTITEPTALVLSVEAAPAVDGNNGSADLSVEGGSTPYSYQWSNGVSTQDIVNLSGGQYNVTVTDNNGCIELASVVIETINTPALSVSITSASNVSCNGGQNGSATGQASGGFPPYTYTWSNGQSGNTAASLAAGTYTLLVTDSENGQATAQVTVTEPTALVLDIDSTPAVDGNNGSADLSVEGGNAPYSYKWSNDATTEDISNLAGGEYGVTVMDDNGCIATASVFIETINTPALSVSITSASNVSCNGGQNGSATGQASGGFPPYTYSWSNGQSGNTAASLEAGTYTLLVTDSENGQATAQVTITEPTALVLDIDSTPAVDGNNGSADLSVEGGNAPYSYKWSNDATTQDINNLAGGEYGVTVTDDNGCTATASVFIETINTPALTVSITSTSNVSCNGWQDGSAIAQASGGFPPYTYSWSNGQSSSDATGLAAGTYTLVVTDSENGQTSTEVSITEPTALLLDITSTDAINGNNGSADLSVEGGNAPYSYDWSNGATTQDIFNLAGGEYEVIVTDANGCPATAIVFIETINTPALTISINAISNVSCNGGQDGRATSQASGGFPPYSYAWSNGQTGNSTDGLTAGTYTVVVIDSENNEAATEVTISEPTALTLNITSTNAVDGNNGTADLNVEGGTSPYSYKWSNEATNEDISNLAGGEYGVTVTDDNGCMATASVFIETINTPALTVNITSIENVSCNGGQNGSASGQANGGFPPYTYLWSNGQNGSDATDLAAGTYILTVKDSENGEATAQITITEPTALTLTITSTDAIDGVNGSADLSVHEGNAPYTYQWSNGATTEDISGLAGGNYEVIVTDANGCTATASVKIEEIQTPPSDDVLVLEHGLLSGVGEAWQTVTLENTYNSMVVVASLRLASANAPSAITRIRNANDNSFEIRIQTPGGVTLHDFEVDYLVVEEGIYTEDAHGITMEAVKANAAETAASGDWVRETRAYQNEYNNPVVLGQVMTTNDERWSAFWCSADNSRNKPPKNDSFAAGKHIGEDTDTERLDETIGYVVFEEGTHTVNGQRFQTALGDDIVKGVDNASYTSEYSYDLENLLGASSAIVSVAAMDGNGGGWPALFGLNPISGSALNLIFIEDQVKDTERSHTTEQVAYIVFEDENTIESEISPLVFEQGILEGIRETWTTIELENNYENMVVVATVVQANADTAPVITRIQNAEGNSFQLKVQSPGGMIDGTYQVHYMVAEAGVYTEAVHGITMEAHTTLSTQTSARNIWKYEYQSYENSYNNPVVLGQVMSYNDDRWSVFWANSGKRKNAPENDALAIGKHVGEDSQTSRNNETLGYIVFEGGTGNINGLNFAAGLGDDNIQSASNSASGYQYDIPALIPNGAAILSSAGMDGSDCSWPVLFGATPTASETLHLAVDEDQMKDIERSHTTEQVAYIVFDGMGSNSNLEMMPTNENTPLSEVAPLENENDDEEEIMEERTISNDATQYQPITVYPNPATDFIQFEHQFTTSGEAQILITDIMGKVITQQNIQVEAGQVEKLTLNISNFNNGQYFLNIIIGKERLAEKFVKTAMY